MNSGMDLPLGQNELFYSYTPSYVARTAYFYVQCIGYFCRSKNYIIQRKGMSCYLLLYTISGKGCLKYRGKSYELVKRSLMLINLEKYHEYYTDSIEYWEFKWFHFNGCGSAGYFNTIIENYGPVIGIPEGNPLPAYINDIMQFIISSDIQLEIKVSGMIFQILTEILLCAAKTSFCIKECTSSNIEAVLEFIRANYYLNVTLNDMAKIACISTYHFSRIFKKITGYAPYEYLINYRINMAKALLGNTICNIDEIAGRVGFDSTSNFIKKFRETEGITPLKYRRFWMQ